MRKYLALLIFIFLFGLVSSSVESDYWKSQKYADLIIELKKIGFSEDEIDSLFSDSRVKFYSRVTKKFKTTKVPRLADPKSSLMSIKSVNKGKEFTIKNKEILKKIEKEYGIEKEVIAAILRIESYFGQKVGSYQVFGVLNSIILYGKSDSSRSKWAKKQIVALLIICRGLKISPLEIRGSWAGAIGIPQFIPTSYLEFAIDGNKDGKINLFNLEDAIYSIANYLIKHKWKDNKSKALYAYNRSWNYVEGVQAYAKKL